MTTFIEITGYLCAASYLLLFVKLFTRLLSLKKADRFIMKIHELSSGVFCLALLVHMVMNFISFQPGRPEKYALGLGAGFIALLLITLCHLMKEPKAKFMWHRILAIAAILLMAAHIIL